MPLRATTFTLVLLLFFGLWSPAVAANETLSAGDIARLLQERVFSGAGVTMKFRVKGGEQFTVKSDVKSRKVRIESASMTIVSDGSTVWNYQKKNNQVTIDQLGAGRGSALENPQEIFRFADNYSARIVSNKRNAYTLEFTPKAQIQPALNAAGGIKSITFSVTVNKGKIQIKNAAAQSTQGKTETGALSVTPVKVLKSGEFTFTPPKGARVIDLRD